MTRTSQHINRFRPFRWTLAAAGLVCTLLASLGAQAVPITYTLDFGSLDTVQMVDITGPITPTPCPIGVGNCLEAPVAVTSAYITIDTDTNTLLDLNIQLNGTGQLNMAGLNGYETVLFTGTTFQSSTTTDLVPFGAQLNIVPGIPGLVSVDTVDVFLLGNTSGPADFSVSPYVASAELGGSLILSTSATELLLTLTGVVIGVFDDPITGADPVVTKADFSMVLTSPQPAQPIPEPNSAALFGAGLLIASARMRWDWITRA